MSVEWTPGAPKEIDAPLVVVAFEGWADAVSAASGAVDYLGDRLHAEPIAELGGDDCFDYLEARPMVTQRKGLPSGLSWPRITASVCRAPGTDHDVVLVVGPEPALRWQHFAAEFVDFVDSLDASQVVLLGAYLAETPHTRELPLTGTAFSRARLQEMRVEPADYQGPTGMTGVLQQVLTDAGVPTVSLWVGIPHYASSAVGFGGAYRLVGWVVEHLGIEVEVGPLREEYEMWVEHIDAAAVEDSELGDYVRALESDFDDELGRIPGTEEADAVAAEHIGSVGPDPEPDRADHHDAERMRLVDGDALAAEFERYLRGGGSDTSERGSD